MSDPNEIVGHKTIDAGERDENGLPIYRHEPMTRALADILWQRARERVADRAARMPDDKAAILALNDAYQRLYELGWREPRYCPKDGTRFKVIELGSTGIFDCTYHGKWPDGHYMVMDDHDVYPTSTGVAMFRLYPEDEAKEKARMEAARARYLAQQEAEDNLTGAAASDAGHCPQS